MESCVYARFALQRTGLFLYTETDTGGSHMKKEIEEKPKLTVSCNVSAEELLS